MRKRNPQKQELRTDMMLQNSISRIIPRMAFPTIMSFLINSIYSFTDMYFISSLGTNATAAVSINSSLDIFILMMGSLFAVGAASYIARLLGRDDSVTASRVFSTAFFTAIVMGTLLLIGGQLFVLPMVRLLGASLTCEQHAVDYAQYLLLGAPIMPSCFVMNHCLRSEGYSAFSMIGMCTSSIVNCMLDPLFIFGFNMGIGGAALATTISKWIMFTILISHYVSHRSVIELSVRFFTVSKDIAFKIISVGASSFFRLGLEVLAAIILNNIAGAISDSVLAGVGVCAKIMNFPIGIIHGFCNGALPVIGINWGAGQYKRVEDIRRFCSRIALASTLAMMTLLMLFAREIIVRLAGTDTAMLKVGTLCVISQSIVLPIYAYVFVVNIMCTALGKVKYSLVLATSRRGICFIPILYLLFLGLGAYGVAVSQAVAELLTLGLAIPINFKLWRLIHQKMQPCMNMSAPFDTES